MVRVLDPFFKFPPRIHPPTARSEFEHPPAFKALFTAPRVACNFSATPTSDSPSAYSLDDAPPVRNRGTDDVLPRAVSSK